MVFLSFGRLAQSWLPESVRIQVKRQDRLIWLEKWTLQTVVGRWSLAFCFGERPTASN
jgi:hypothetical protein